MQILGTFPTKVLTNNLVVNIDPIITNDIINLTCDCVKIVKSLQKCLHHISHENEITSNEKKFQNGKFTVQIQIKKKFEQTIFFRFTNLMDRKNRSVLTAPPIHNTIPNRPQIVVTLTQNI